MQSPCSRALWAALLLPAALYSADVFTEGTVSVGGGTAMLNGDRPAFQKATQHNMEGFFGLEEFKLTREADDSVFTFDARIMAGDDDYRLAARWEKPQGKAASLVIDKQWNSLSELCVTILSRTFALGLSRSHLVNTSPSSSRSFAPDTQNPGQAPAASSST